MKERILRFFKKSKVSTTEIILLVAVCATIGFKFSNQFNFRSDTPNDFIQWDYIDPKVYPPRPSEFPYMDRY